MSRPFAVVPVFSLVALLATLAAPAGAQNTPSPSSPFFLPANIPATDVDPVMDGMATDAPEWEDAMRLPDSFFFGTASRSGFYYFERRNDWNAVAASALAATGAGDGDGVTYEGITLFIAHDIVGSPDASNPLHQFQVDEDRDWNSFDFSVPTGRATIWVFDGINDPDDSDWLPFAEGLDTSVLVTPGTAPDLIDDRGFIARLNDDPSTDVHWMEGQAEPGDAGWVWEDFHWVFGRRTFGQSFQSTGLDPDPENAVDHEVYEACSYRPDFDPDDDDPPPPFCLWWEDTVEQDIEIKDVVVMKDGVPTKAKVKVPKNKIVPILKGQWWLHYWDDEVYGFGVPELGTWANLIGAEFNAAAIAANPPQAALEDIAFVVSHAQGLMFALIALQYDPAVQSLKFLRIHMGRAEKKGLDKLAWRHARIHLISFVYYTLALRFMGIDAGGTTLAGDGAAGVPLTDAELNKVSRSFYKFGKAFQKAAAKGSKGQAGILSTLLKLKPAGKALDELDPGP